MSDTPNVLDYARPARRSSAWAQPEAWLATLSNVTLVVIAVVGRAGRWAGLEGLAAGLFIVAFALVMTVTFIAGFGVLTAYIDGPTTAARQRLAWTTFAIAFVNAAAFVAVTAWAVARI